MEKEDKKAKIYSHSRLWLYESCPEAYKAKYIDKNWPDIPANAELFLGDSVHKTLEWLYKEAENRTPEIDEMINFFLDKWNSGFSEDIVMRKGDKEHYKNKGVKFLVDYYMKNKPFRDGTIAIEKRIVFDLDDEGEYKIQGYVDRIVKKTDGVYEVHDYKTNDYMKNQEQVDSDRQLAFYHLGIKNLFEDAKEIRLIWHFLAFNHSMISQRKDNELEKLKRDTLNLIREIETNKNWFACGKPWCDWCSWKSRMQKEHGYSFVRDKNANLSKFF